MIIDIAHIALVSEDLKTDVSFFTSKGYEEKFLIREVKNPSNKKKFLSKYSDCHDVAFVSKKGSFSIEIIDYGHINNESGFICDSRHLIDREKDFNNLTICSSDIEKSLNFWKSLNFKKLEETQNVLEFGSFFSKSRFKLEIKEQQTSNIQYYLDNKGFNCIAFITSNIENEITDISQKCNHIKVSDIDSVEINGKKFKIAFIQNNKNEIIELLEVIKV